MEASMDAVIFGAGAIGTFVGAVLHSRGHRVRWVLRDSERARRQLAVLHARGLVLDCATDAGFRVEISAAAARTLFRIYDPKEAAEDWEGAGSPFHFAVDHPVCAAGAAVAGDGPRCLGVWIATKRGASLAQIHRDWLVPYCTAALPHTASPRHLLPVVFLQNGFRTCYSDVVREEAPAVDATRARDAIPVTIGRSSIPSDPTAPLPYFPIEAVVDYNTIYNPTSSHVVSLAQTVGDGALVLGPSFLNDRRFAVTRISDGATEGIADTSAFLKTFAEELRVLKAMVAACGGGEPARGAVALNARVVHNIADVQCGKLLLNLTNAVNALSGIGIGKLYRQRPYRLVLKACAVEAKRMFEWEGLAPVAPKPADAVTLKLLDKLLPLPDWLFVLAVGRKLKGRDEAHTSMSQDFIYGRVPTEVRFLNGAVVWWGARHGLESRVNRRVVDLVEAAEEAIRRDGPDARPRWAGPALLDAVSGPPGTTTVADDSGRVLPAAVCVGAVVCAAAVAYAVAAAQDVH